jgi:hypothetical protein
MLWNFLETIHDRCEGNSADKQTLRETWGPVLTAENSVHRGWFLMEMRREAHAAHQAQREGKHYEPSYKFCEAFRVFVLERRWNDAAHENHDDRCWAYRRTFRNPPKFGLA